MSIAHEGSQLPIQKVCLPIDWKNTSFLAHYDITAEESLSGIAPLDGAVYTLRPDEGKYGGAIAVEEGTKNYIANDGEATNPWIGSDGVNVRTLSTDFAKFGTQSMKWTWTSGYSNFYMRPNTGDTSLNWTFSCYVKRADGQPVTGLGMYIYSQANNAFDIKNITPVSDGWYRVAGTITNTIATQVTLIGFFNMATTTSWYFDGWQLEAKSFASSYTTGTRAAGVLTYPIAPNASEGTIAMWVYVNDALKDPSNYRHIFSIRTDTDLDDGLVFFHNNGSAHFRVKTSNSAGSQSNFNVSDTLVPNGWRFFAVRWNSQRVSLFVDGKEVGYATNPPLPTAYQAKFMVGHELGGLHMNSMIDELRMDSIYQPDDIINAWYQSQAPFFPKGIHKQYL